MIVQSRPVLVFGGINETFLHATVTEQFLVGKSLKSQKILFQAFALLSSELKPSNNPVDASPDYRRSLALSLFYKFLLYLNQAHISPRNQSAIASVIDTRPISFGKQSFPKDPSIYPITQPMSKLNSKLQVLIYIVYYYRIFQI